MTDMIIGPPPESWWRRTLSQIKLHPAVYAAIVAGFFGLVGLWLGSRLEASQLKHRVAGLEASLIHKDAEIQRLETLLTPFRTIALERFTGSDAEVLKKLAEQLTLLQSADERKAAEINKLKATVTDLTPAFMLLETKQVEEGDVWVTRLAFGSKVGHPFPKFAIAVTFDKTYESAKPYVTGQGMVVAGELRTL